MKWALLILTGFIFLLCVFSLYWFAVRPSMIKHDCSWYKMHSDPVSFRPAMTQAELEAKGIIRTCKNEFDLLHKEVPSFDPETDNAFTLSKNFTLQQSRIIWNAQSCREDGDRIIADYKKPIEAQPAKDWYVKANQQQYTFCLHDKGL